MTEEVLTISVPEAGRRYFGVSRNTSYALAVDGTIPTSRVGKMLRVPIRAMERLLDNARTAPSPVARKSRASKGKKATKVKARVLQVATA